MLSCSGSIYSDRERGEKVCLVITHFPQPLRPSTMKQGTEEAPGDWTDNKRISDRLKFYSRTIALPVDVK